MGTIESNMSWLVAINWAPLKNIVPRPVLVRANKFHRWQENVCCNNWNACIVQKKKLLGHFGSLLGTNTSGHWIILNPTVVSTFHSSLLLEVPALGLISPTLRRPWRHQADGSGSQKCLTKSTSTVASSWTRRRWWLSAVLRCLPVALRPTSTTPTLMHGHQDRI